MPSHSTERHTHDPYAYAVDHEGSNHFKNAQVRYIWMDLASPQKCTVLQTDIADNCVCLNYQLQGKAGAETQGVWVQMTHWVAKKRIIVYFVPRPPIRCGAYRNRFETQMGYRRMYVGGLPAEPFGPASDVVCALFLARGIRAIGAGCGHVDTPDRPMVGNITVVPRGGKPRAAFVWLTWELFYDPKVWSALEQSAYVDEDMPVELDVQESVSNIQQ